MKTFISNESLSIDSMLYMHFIPFKDLRPILEPLTSQHPVILNVYIDLYSMTTSIYRAYNYNDPISLTACFANAAIHYRNFFKQYGIYTNIFLLYSPTASPNNLRYCPEYNQEHIMERANNYEARKLIDNNLELFATIVPYMPDIFLRIGTVETSIMAIDMIQRTNPNIINLIISSSPIAFQIPTICPNAYVLYRTRSKQLYLVNQANALGTAIKYQKKVEPDVMDINPAWISGYFTYVGMPKRSLGALLDYKKALTLLRQIRDNNELLTGASLTKAYLSLSTKRKKTEETILNINNRFSCLDFNNQLIMYRLMPESKESSYLVQIQNMEELYHLNHKYFRSNMIQLDKL